MSSKKCGLEDLLGLFEDSVDPSDVLASKIMAQISSAITKERLKLRMNQSQFAEHINASQSLVSRWEQGNYNFSIRKIAEIASILDLNVNFSFYSASALRTKNSIEYTEPVTFVKTVRFDNPNKSFTCKSSGFVQASSFHTISKNQEENNYASLR